jgi:hypothetical protein
MERTGPCGRVTKSVAAAHRAQAVNGAAERGADDAADHGTDPRHRPEADARASRGLLEERVAVRVHEGRDEKARECAGGEPGESEEEGAHAAHPPARPPHGQDEEPSPGDCDPNGDLYRDLRMQARRAAWDPEGAILERLRETVGGGHAVKLPPHLARVEDVVKRAKRTQPPPGWLR